MKLNILHDGSGKIIGSYQPSAEVSYEPGAGAAANVIEIDVPDSLPITELMDAYEVSFVGETPTLVKRQSNGPDTESNQANQTANETSAGLGDNVARDDAVAPVTPRVTVTPGRGGASPSSETTPDSGPTDPSIPEGWDRSAPASDERASGVTVEKRGNATCTSWDVIRTLLGPVRWGPCTPVGGPVLIPWYRGNCDWDVYKTQFGTAPKYQLVNVISVRITVCDDTRSEEVIGRMVPFWKYLGDFKTTCSETKLTERPLHGEGPYGTGDCPEFWEPLRHGGLPSSIADWLEREKERQRQTDPTVTSAPYPLGPLPPPQPVGPTIGSAPSPQEAARRAREEAERESLNPFGHPQGHGEHPHEDETAQQRANRELIERMRRSYELERELERMLRRRRR